MPEAFAGNGVATNQHNSHHRENRLVTILVIAPAAICYGVCVRACDTACPMRLAPRNIKRMMFSCVQCGQCVTACETSHSGRGTQPNLQWTVGVDALRETLRQRHKD